MAILVEQPIITSVATLTTVVTVATAIHEQLHQATSSITPQGNEMLANSTHMVFLLDRSGSMGNCWNDTTGGLQALLEEQKTKPGAMTVSVYTFDDFMEKAVDFVNVKEVGNFLDGV